MTRKKAEINGPITPNEWRVLNLLDIYGAWYGEGGFGFPEPASNKTNAALKTLQQRGFVMSEFIEAKRPGYTRTRTVLRYGLIRDRIPEWKAQLPPLPETETRSQNTFDIWWGASKLQDEVSKGGVDKQLASAIFRAGRLSTFDNPLEASKSVEP